MGHAEHIDAHLCGKSQDINFIQNSIISWIEAEINSGSTISRILVP